MSAPLVGSRFLLLALSSSLISLSGFAWQACRASGSDDISPPAAVVAAMEERAAQADPRDQCYLYTEVLQSLIEVEGRQVGAGDDQAASATLNQINQVAARLKSAETADAKKLKNAEELMHRTTRRLGDMLHLTSGTERTAMKATLDQLNRVHDEILTLVFSR